jgi:hypothetical protein
MSAKEIYENQRKLAQLKGGLQSLEYGLYEEAARNPALGMTDQERVNGHPDVIKGQREVATLTAEVDQAQEQIGGKVYRVPGENVYDLKKKIGKLNRKAAKLNCPEITYRVVETDEEERKIIAEGGVEEKRLFIWDYVALKGAAPMVPGYRFIAALDHTVQEKEGDPLIIKQVPTIEEELDLSAYRNADPRCDHCQKIRSRNTTYLIEEIATGKISKVGSSCLSDFTGTNDPASA